MQPGDIQRQIDQILDRHIQGKRRTDQTLDNLRNLFRSLHSINDQQFFENHLISRFISELGIGTRPGTSGVSTRPEPVAVITSILLELSSEQQRVLAVLLSNLSLRDDKGLEIWTNQALPEIAMAVRLKKVKGSSIDLLQNILWLNSTKRNTNLFPREVPASLGLAVDQVLDAVDDAEFSEFEEQLRMKSGGTSAAQPSAPPTEQDHVPLNVREALAEAESHLQGTQTLDPKTAADLIRTCIDETHRDLVGKVSRITGNPYTGPDKDGARRTYLRDSALYSQPEEIFVSSLYTLLSSSASHVLITRRDMIVIMRFAVESFIEALYRRFEELKMQYSSTKP